MKCGRRRRMRCYMRDTKKSRNLVKRAVLDARVSADER